MLGTLDERAVLSYLVVPRGLAAVPVHVSDARSDEPLFGNGLAFKQAPRFTNLYSGPRRPELNGFKASAYRDGTNLILSGTVAGTIIAKPASAAEESVYTFGIDRGGASRQGPFPGREPIRFDAVAVASFRQTGPAAYVQTTDPLTHQPRLVKSSLPLANLTVQGSVLTLKVP